MDNCDYRRRGRARPADTLASDGVGAFRARMPQPAGEDDEFAQDVLF